jgi:hypothetical protein
MSKEKFPVSGLVSVLITIVLIGAVFDRIYEIYRIYSRRNSPPSIGNCDSPMVKNMAKDAMIEEISKVITENYFAATGIIDPSTVRTLASPGDPDLPPNVLYSCSARMIFRTGSGEVLRGIVMYTVEKDKEGYSYVKAGFQKRKEDAPAEETPSPDSTTGAPADETPSPSAEIVEPADEASNSSAEMPLETETPNAPKRCAAAIQGAAEYGGAFTCQVSADFVAVALAKSGSRRNKSRNRKK